ncbi:hypothetical protein FisN_19Lh149 [Fistulifera solaris]|uniref:tRNA (guanine(46)-N(7))-methyltransferase n=1 Tax=Fistulifera solaris TaxID=1519565 RepID=A0A1Z5J7B7_FISSO|nr:hypothetical protein FisN_19Lh149 [Fistulifera solaris]|eukprot:GAX09681.1 hypothetical protein FisN_19Lh149 [Fistulifera solaris]
MLVLRSSHIWGGKLALLCLFIVSCFLQPNDALLSSLSLSSSSSRPLLPFTLLFLQQSSQFFNVVLEDPLVVLSPTTVAQINDILQQRDQARRMQNFTWADHLLQSLPTLITHNCSIRVTDTNEGKSQWSVVYHIMMMIPHNQTSTVLPLAHQALGSAVAEGYNNRNKKKNHHEARDRWVQQAISQLQAWSNVHSLIVEGGRHSIHRTPSSSSSSSSSSVWQTVLQHDDLSTWAAIEAALQGRKSADAAFWFALAGVTDEHLFVLLTKVVCKELRRFGTRPSCRLKDLLAIAQRMAAAGIRNDRELNQVLQQCFEAKQATFNNDQVVSFHSDGCALLLWEFSTRQKKPKAFWHQAAQHFGKSSETALQDETFTPYPFDWYQLFQDPHRPLVIDVGCGMGVCLLGLASQDDDNSSWENCNFLGIDLNAVTIHYGAGLAERWNLSDRLAFVVDTAEHALQQVFESYPGNVANILIQFPTPYRLQDNSGNTQLPRSATDGFMVSLELLQLCRAILVPDNGTLWLQSNCEDVAVWMFHTACQQAGFTPVLDVNESSLPEGVIAPSALTQRTRQWIAMGGERAQGPGWIYRPLLPRTAMTETEVACLIKGTPVHRCILSPTAEWNE